MEVKNLTVGDRVKLKTREKVWQGIVLESYDSEILLLKLDTGYNIGIRESEVLQVEVVEKAHDKKSKESFYPVKKVGLRNVALIITGGTISSRLDPKTGAVISTDAEEILRIAPEIREICNIVRLEKPFMKWSEDMSFKDWKMIALTVEKLVNDAEIDGVIISHGTDFLHYTCAALSLFLGKLNKPVALTYSQKSIDRGSTDAHLNLLCAARFAVSDIAEVALIGHKDAHDHVCLAMPGLSVRKLHTSARDAFKIVNDEPLAEITTSSFTVLKSFNARDNQKMIKVDVSFEEKIAIIKVFPGQDASILDYYATQGYKGIILEVSGMGHVPGINAKHNWWPKIKKLVKEGVVVCATAQTIFGRLNPQVYSAGRELLKTGIIFLDTMTSESALVKLGFVLGHKDWNVEEKVKE